MRSSSCDAVSWPGAAARWRFADRDADRLPDRVDGLGPPPSFETPDYDTWAQASTHMARNRLWLTTHQHQPATSPTPSRSLQELEERRVQLEVLFTTAPRDQSRLIHVLTTGQLTLDNLNQTLDHALSTQNERRHWILEHWPHIVEQTQITHALATDTHSPDRHPLVNQAGAGPPPFEIEVS
jgi:hypothetical protein